MNLWQYEREWPTTKLDGSAGISRGRKDVGSRGDINETDNRKKERKPKISYRMEDPGWCSLPPSRRVGPWTEPSYFLLGEGAGFYILSAINVCSRKMGFGALICQDFIFS